LIVPQKGDWFDQSFQKPSQNYFAKRKDRNLSLYFLNQEQHSQFVHSLKPDKALVY